MGVKTNKMIEQLMSFFSRDAKETKNQVPEGYCPNCWGSQEYDNQIRDLYQDNQIDVNNHSAHHAFIQEFVVERLDGIKLKKGNNGVECPTCHFTS